jgi:uncharacterized membrane protein
VDPLCRRRHVGQRRIAYVGAARHPDGHGVRCVDGDSAVGAFVVGILAFGDSASTMRIVSIALIVAGIISLKLA